MNKITNVIDNTLLLLKGVGYKYFLHKSTILKVNHSILTVLI